VSAKIAKGPSMSVAEARTVSELVSYVERRKRSRILAYEHVGKQIGRSATWVRDLIGRGLGRVDTEIKARLDALLIRELEAEIVRLQAELEMARQSGAHPASIHFSEIETHLARAKALMRGGMGDARDSHTDAAP
jgi:hypothetical protein